MSDLDIEITPNHQGLAARGSLAAVEFDAARLDAVLGEVRAAGMETALAVIGVLSRNVGSTLVATSGFTAARLTLERTIVEAQAAGDE